MSQHGCFPESLKRSDSELSGGPPSDVRYGRTTSSEMITGLLVDTGEGRLLGIGPGAPPGPVGRPGTTVPPAPIGMPPSITAP